MNKTHKSTRVLWWISEQGEKDKTHEQGGYGETLKEGGGEMDRRRDFTENEQGGIEWEVSK